MRCCRMPAVRFRSSLPAALAVAALVAAGCGASSSNDKPTVTMDQAAAAAVAHAEAMAEAGESVGYITRADKGWQSRQNGYETLKRERCKRLHPNSACRIKHIRLRSSR
jgi:hypothetical protein